MKFISPLLALLVLVSCAGVLLADQTNIQIITSEDKLINSVTNDDNFKILSDRITGEIQKKFLDRNIVSSTEEKINGDKNKLMIEYEYLETEMGSREIHYVMKGQFKLINSKTQKVLLNDDFDQREHRISEFVNSVSNQISEKVIRYFRRGKK